MEEESDEERPAPPEPQNESISNKLIRKIIQERREKKHLAEDLKSIKQNFKKLNVFIKSSEDRTIEKVTNILINHHHLFYYIFLHGMEKAQDLY